MQVANRILRLVRRLSTDTWKAEAELRTTLLPIQAHRNEVGCLRQDPQVELQQQHKEAQLYADMRPLRWLAPPNQTASSTRPHAPIPAERCTTYYKYGRATSKPNQTSQHTTPPLWVLITACACHVPGYSPAQNLPVSALGARSESKHLRAMCLQHCIKPTVTSSSSVLWP